jgi:hypothetical protein
MANIVLPFVTTFNDKGVKQGQASLGALAKSSLAGAVSVGVVVDQLGKAVKAAAEDQKAQEQLELAVRNNTSANTDQIAAMEETIGRMEMQKAVADDELRPALGNLVRATGDVEKAQSLLNLALDISAATGRDLQSVTIALSRAQTGSMTALTRLGIPLSAAAVKSKDLSAIQDELRVRFAGASDAAAASADGGMKKLQIALDNTYEAVGYKLLPVLGDYVTVLADLSGKALNAEEENSKFGTAFNYLAKQMLPVLQILPFINKGVKNYADNVRGATSATDDFERIFRLQNMNMSKATVTLKDNSAAQRSANDAKEKAKRKAKDYADTLRGRVQTSLEIVNDRLKEAQADFDGYSQSLSDAITGSISLADAYKTQTDADKESADALRERTEAYQELNRINPTEDADNYADALNRVAKAEENVRVTAEKRKKASVEQVFADQIANAREFAQNLQYLVQHHNLGQAALSQLINLGVDAGNEVTRAMIMGTSGLTAGGLNESLGSITSAASTFGMAGANQFFGSALGTATQNANSVNQYSITVNAGLVSNPAQVGRDIIEAIKNAERVSGQVFVSV